MIDTVLIDMDGVIADYYRAVLPHTKATITYDEWPPGSKDFEGHFGMLYADVMKNAGSDFWANIPKTPWFDSLFCSLETNRATVNADLHILTSPPYVEHHEGITPSHIADAIRGKLEWTREHTYEIYIRGMVSFSWKKYIAANEHTLIIDDSEHNIDPFLSLGGKAILIPGLHNRRHGEYHDMLNSPDEWFEEELSKICQVAT